jgi:hypothetical protein
MNDKIDVISDVINAKVDEYIEKVKTNYFNDQVMEWEQDNKKSIIFKNKIYLF